MAVQWNRSFDEVKGALRAKRFIAVVLKLEGDLWGLFGDNPSQGPIRPQPNPITSPNSVRSVPANPNWALIALVKRG